MCYGCWQKAGKPQIDNPLVRLAAELAGKVYGRHCAGGRLHILLDDWNVNQDHIKFCEERLKADAADSPEQHEAEAICLRVFKVLRYKERISALALHDRFWGQ